MIGSTKFAWSLLLGWAFSVFANPRFVSHADAQPALVRGATPPPAADTTGRAVRALIAPAIDGRMNDAVWISAPPMTEFRQFDPGEDQPTAFRTEVRAAYDDRYLYVIVRAFE